MYTNSISLKEEKKDKRRGMLFTVFFHVGLVALAIIPFLSPSEPEIEDAPQAIVIDFTDFNTSSKKSKKGKKAKPTPTKKKTVEKEVKKTPKVKPTPKPTPAQAPVNTTEEPNPPLNPPAETKVETPPVPTPAPVEEIKEEVEAPAETEAPAEEVAEVESTSEDAGTAEDTGNMDDGTATSAGKSEEGTSGAGEGWVDLGGDGIFNRKVVYRADVKKITKEEGTIVIKLCISQNGSVVFAEYDEENSTIKNKSILKDTELTARKYKFAKDYSAPYKQCGKLTFIFDLDS